MQKIWNSEADYNDKSDFSGIRVVSDQLTLNAGVEEGYVRLRFDASDVMEWQTLTWTNKYLYPVSKAKVRVRTNDTATLSYDDFSFDDSVLWTSYFVDTPSDLIKIKYIRNSQYIELEVYLETNQRTYDVPTVSNIILTYKPDTKGPAKPKGVRVSVSGRNIAPFWSR